MAGGYKEARQTIKSKRMLLCKEVMLLSLKPEFGRKI